MESILAKLRAWADRGVSMPIIRDPVTDMPSITLTFPYIAFALAVHAVIQLLGVNTLYGTVAALLLWLMATILYLIRKLNKVKLDIDQQSLELEGGDSEPKS